MSVIVLDSGNSIIKAIIARRERGKIAFPQALDQIYRMSTQISSHVQV